jgi:hypothetical protein
VARYSVPAGRIIKGWSVRLDPSEQQAARFRRDDGARRFACNWAVGEIRQAFSGGQETGQYDSVISSPSAARCVAVRHPHNEGCVPVPPYVR